MKLVIGKTKEEIGKASSKQAAALINAAIAMQAMLAFCFRLGHRNSRSLMRSSKKTWIGAKWKCSTWTNT